MLLANVLKNKVVILLSLYAIMYDIGPKIPDTGIRPRRYELGINAKGGLKERVEALQEMFEGRPSESILRAGYKELPEDTNIREFLDGLHRKYGGDYNPLHPDAPFGFIVFRDQQSRQSARRLMEAEQFVID